MEEIKAKRVQEAKDRMSEGKKALQAEKQKQLKELKGTFQAERPKAQSNIGDAFADFMYEGNQQQSPLKAGLSRSFTGNMISPKNAPTTTRNQDSSSGDKKKNMR